MKDFFFAFSGDFISLISKESKLRTSKNAGILRVPLRISFKCSRISAVHRLMFAIHIWITSALLPALQHVHVAEHERESTGVLDEILHTLANNRAKLSEALTSVAGAHQQVTANDNDETERFASLCQFPHGERCSDV